MSEFILSAFADEIDPDPEVQMDVLERHGIRHIELRGAHGRNVADFTEEEAETLQRRFEARGFQVSAVGSPVGKTFLDEPFEPAYRQFLHVVRLAGIFRTTNIRIFSFFLREGQDPRAFRGEVLRRLRAFVDVAVEKRLLLLHENEKEIYGDIPERCLDLFDSIGSPALMATYDPSNFVQCGVRNYPHAFRMLRDRIACLHMKDSVTERQRPAGEARVDPASIPDAHRPVGLGDGQCREILAALHQEGFSGFLSLEPHLSNCQQVPGTGAEKFDVAVAALKALLAEIGA